MPLLPLRPTATPRRSLGLAWRYFKRAMRLRCPECGISPVFPPLKEMRGPSDLFTTLKDCPICRYVYDREEGYFLIATWAFSYGVGALIALGLYLYMEYWLNASLSRMLWTILPIVMVINVLTARHARSLWLAVDHFFDPQACWRVAEDGDNDGVVTCPAPPVERPMSAGK